MTRLGFGGRDQVARILARAGWAVSARSVGRYRKEPTVPADPTPGPEALPKRTTPVFTRFVHHTWMMDVSHIEQFLGPDLYMAAVFEAHSRVPLALRVFTHKPGASKMVRLLRQAARRFNIPRYVITDRGSEFDAGIFRRAVRRLGARQRFAAVDSLRATARLERFWRTLKESAGLSRPLGLPLGIESVESRLQLALLHYIAFRPHSGLDGATPLEVFRGSEPVHRKAVEPPRGRPGEGPGQIPFGFTHLDSKARRLPIVIKAA